MALGTESSVMTNELLTQLDSPHGTPSLGMSRRSSRHGSSSPAISSSPPPIPPRGDLHLIENRDRDVTNDEKISILDPRRFTPSLHASLVSEILSLRREVESKNGLVLGLEENLHVFTDENARLNDVIAVSTKENRFMKRQMELLEGGTLSALEDVAKERDEAQEILADTRRRLELSQRKVRSQDEEADRSHSSWEGDRQKWIAEKTALDRKIHTVEGRLKAVLMEVEAAHANDQQRLRTYTETDNYHHDGVPVKRSQSRSSHHRRDSTTSNGTHPEQEPRSYRYSRITGPKGTTFIGATLAEELDFDEDDEADREDSDIDAGYISPEALPEEAIHRPRRVSTHSHRESTKARKVLGLTIEEEDTTHREGTQKAPLSKISEQSNIDLTSIEEYVPNYTSTATQSSPPASPRTRSPEGNASTNSIGAPKSTDAEQEVGNNGLDRVLVNHWPSNFTMVPNVMMVSQSSQTVDLPLSPPDTPVTSESATFAADRTFQNAELKTTSTQTDEWHFPSQAVDAAAHKDSATTNDIPIIAIHPPITETSVVRSSVVLPPHTKNASCQVSLRAVPLRSISVQTEEIRIDNRPVKLPLHLLPSSISSSPPSPAPDSQVLFDSTLKRTSTSGIVAVPIGVSPAQTTASKKGLPFGATEDAYPGNNDNGPLDHIMRAGPRRPIRSESLFAGFAAVPDDENVSGTGLLDDADYSDDSSGGQEPIRKTLSKVQNSWKLIPQTEDSLGNLLESGKPDTSQPAQLDGHDGRTSLRLPVSERIPTPLESVKEHRNEKVPRSTLTTKQPNMRRAALISSGTIAHIQRPRSPSAPDLEDDFSKEHAPPFPVPTRASSRRIPVSASEGASSPTPQSTSFFSGQMRKEHGRPPIKRPVLRKIRSAAPTAQSPHDGLNRKPSRSPPPPPSPAISVPPSPQLPPPLPKDGITSRFRENFSQAGHHHQSSNATETIPQQTSVVDAIAQTMIGEWMWKYVRKRKSFGMAESPAAEFETGRTGNDSVSVNGIRHKRWVWLAPYERAIMWSSKQPTSGSALMGKSGRKLAIQSVLDVRDDTPMPKNADAISTFGRSILILTPQRALKFTALTKERHYVWLAALSFLSHSSLGTDDLSTLPPVPPKEFYRAADQRSTAVLRRNPIRDSIRLAKGQSRPDIIGRRAYTTPSNELQEKVINEYTGNFVQQEHEEAAEPPLVPRFAAHTRHRSNTGPKSIPPNSYRAFPTISKSSNRSLTAASSDTHGYASSNVERPGLGSMHSSFPRRMRGDSSTHTSEVETGNFFDAVGTVRMEAFVDRTRGIENDYVRTLSARDERSGSRQYERPQDEERRPPRNSYRTRQGRKKDMSYWGTSHEVNRIEAVFSKDPFEGF
ncbi:hypothetical protein MMC18_002687 [Xylographa bjoerkii]|nr:hypothetical protein [Xylographa bjoerkii]